ncbi:MAG: hypothetical protein EU548_08970 [Promethearchaeota archaeon]|nr:MAG: hypothetical protein EU548_08970 [Candidatus Lokiarchaeota archaeon]
MKFLIIYFSQTGNTKKIGEAIRDALGKEDVTLKAIEDLKPEKLSNFDVVFLGSGIYASRVSFKLIELLKNANQIPKKFVYFCTHASLELYQKPFNKVDRILKKHNSEVLGSFDCVGENLGIPEKKQKEMLDNLPPEEREKALKAREMIKGHPNKEDLQNVQQFVANILKKLD